MKHHEENLQRQCVQWYRTRHPKRLIFHVPNGGRRKLLEAIRLKKAGVTRGVPDLIIPEPNKDFHGLCVELKVGKNKLTPEQEQMLVNLSSRGYKTEVIYSLEAFQNAVDLYFRNSLIGGV